MSNKKLFFLLVVILLIVSITACTMPDVKSPTVVPSVVYTQAVQTLVANLTVTSDAPTEPITPSLQPTATQTVIPTDKAPLPTATIKPVETATMVIPTSVTPTTMDPIAGLGNPVWREAFDRSASWYTYQDEFVNFQAFNNLLDMTALKANNRNGWVLAPQLASENFYVEMTATFNSKCKGLDRFGLILSPVSSADTGYLFGVSCEGKYMLWVWDGKNMQTLVEWTSSLSIQEGTGKTNRVGLHVDGKKLALYVNNIKLEELTDNTFDKIYFGIFIGAARTEGFSVQVSGLNYWSLP